MSWRSVATVAVRGASLAAAVAAAILVATAGVRIAAADGAVASPDASPQAAVTTLEEAIRLALETSPALAAARADAGAAGADRKTARAARLPRLRVDADWHVTDNQVAVFSDRLTAAEFGAADFALERLNDPEARSHTRAGLVAEVPLFTSGRLRHDAEAADATSGMARERLRAAESETVRQVTEAYAGVLLAETALQVAEGALASVSAHERSAAARYEAGAALKSDLLRSRVKRLGRDLDRERAEADLDVARVRLRVLLGLADGAALRLDPAVIETSAEALADLEGWIEASRRRHPEIEEFRQSERAGAARAAAARAALGPEVDGVARYDRNSHGLGPGDGTFFSGIAVRWSAFDPARAARIDAERWRATAAGARTRVVEDRIRIEVEAAWREARVAARGVATARAAVASAEEARRISAERYGAGLLPLTDLLDDEDLLLQARLAEVAARFQATVGRARLVRAAGVSR